MSATFHNFASLPAELRQHIWELSMEPRRVPVGDFLPVATFEPPAPPTPPPVAPPAALQACAESRLCLELHYVEAFVTEDSRYTLINFDIDTVCMRQSTILEFPDELLSIRHLSIDCNSSAFFWDHVIFCIKPMLFSDPDSDVLELTQDNYLKVYRDSYRRQYAEDPESFPPDVELPDWDDDIDAPHRCLPGWRHAPGCACPPEERWAPRLDF
jgi:2EXR family protein